MTRARIFKPAKTAMQSGMRNTRDWVLEWEPDEQRVPEPLMGWISSADTRGQVRMYFDSKDEAVAFAEKNKYAYRVHDPKPRHIRPKSYADNFAFKRIE